METIPREYTAFAKKAEKLARKEARAAKKAAKTAKKAARAEKLARKEANKFVGQHGINSNDDSSLDVYRLINGGPVTLEKLVMRLCSELDANGVGGYFGSATKALDHAVGEMQTISAQLQLFDGFLSKRGLSLRSAASGYFSVLPPECVLHILSFLPAKDMVTVTATCWKMRNIALDNVLWRHRTLERWPSTKQLFDVCEDTVVDPDDEDTMTYQRARKRYGVRWHWLYAERTLTERMWSRGQCDVASYDGTSSSDHIYCLAFNNGMLARSTATGISLLKPNSVRVMRTYPMPPGVEHSVMCMDLYKGMLIGGVRDSRVCIWNTGNDPDHPKIKETFRVPVGSLGNEPTPPDYVLNGHSQCVRCVRMVDDHTVISGARDGAVRVWGLRDGTSTELRGHTNTVYCLDATEHLIASGSVDNTIRLWSRTDQHCSGVLRGHTNSVRCVHIHNAQMASGSWDNKVMLWDLERALSANTMTDHENRVMCVQMDETKIVSGSADTTVRLWDKRSPRSFVLGGGVSGHRSAVLGLSFNDVEVISAGRDMSVRVWDFTAGAHRSVSSMRSVSSC
jgi:WD40 repeat protein